MNPKGKKKKRRKYRGPILLDAAEQLMSLKFVDVENFTKAAEILHGEKGLPYDLVGDNTIIVPEEAVECFKELSFTATEVLSAGDLPPEEIASLRAENL